LTNARYKKFYGLSDETLEEWKKRDAVRLATKWALRNFEDFYRNFTGILKDGEWIFKKPACISDNYSIESTIP
jgi:hypothetical protein